MVSQQAGGSKGTVNVNAGSAASTVSTVFPPGRLPEIRHSMASTQSQSDISVAAPLTLGEGGEPGVLSAEFPVSNRFSVLDRGPETVEAAEMATGPILEFGAPGKASVEAGIGGAAANVSPQGSVPLRQLLMDLRS